MATQPQKWAIEPGAGAQITVIPDSAGSDSVDMRKLFPSAYELPLEAGGKAVPRREMNYLLAQIFANIFFKQQGGVYEYSAAVDYEVGGIALYGGLIYRCIADNGPAGTVAAPTDPAYWDRLVSASEMESNNNLLCPPGTVLDFAGRTAPAGFLICNGAAVSRATYARLFAVIDVLYGAGDGATTFNLPNFTGRFARGETAAGAVRPACLPSMITNTTGGHTHTRGTMEITGSFPSTETIYKSGYSGAKLSGAFYHEATNVASGSSPNDVFDNDNYSFRASRAWTGSTSAAGDHAHTVVNLNGVATGTTVLPDCVGVLKIIKF